jgi:hypothetical protein
MIRKGLRGKWSWPALKHRQVISYISRGEVRTCYKPHKIIFIIVGYDGAAHPENKHSRSTSKLVPELHDEPHCKHVRRMKGYKLSRYIVLLFRNLGYRWWVVNLTPRPLYPPRKITGTHWILAWVGSRAGLDVSEKRKICYANRDSNPGPFNPYHSRYTDWATPATGKYNSILSSSSALDGGEWSVSGSGCFNPGKEWGMRRLCYSPPRRHGFGTRTFCLALLWTVWQWGSLLNSFCRFLLPKNNWRVFRCHISTSLTCVPTLTRQAILYSPDPRYQFHNFLVLWKVK